MISKAIEISLEAHKNQARKGTEIPYVTHPLAVGFLLAKAGCTDDVIAAGILHDVVEDSEFTLTKIHGTFGDKVTEIVEGCSEPDKSLPWKERKQHTIESLKRAPLEIRIVALADKFHNISSMASDFAEVGQKLWDRFNGSKNEQKWYYEGLVFALRDNTTDEVYQELHSEFAKKVDSVFGFDWPQ